MNSPAPRTSTTAILSLVFGVLAWLALPLIGAVVAIVCGHMARSEIRQAPSAVEGDGLAVAGLVLGYLQLLLGLVALMVVIAAIAGFVTLGMLGH